MYEFLVLSALSRVPMHGYLIAKVLGNIIGPYRQIQWGALYPVLRRLEAEGLIQSGEVCDEEEGRTRKVYSITESGRERLHRHVMDTERHAGEYSDVFYLKVALFSTLTPRERLQLARHYAVHAQRNIDHLEQKRADVAVNSRLSREQREDIGTVMTHRIEHWIHERSFAEQLMARERDHDKETA